MNSVFKHTEQIDTDKRAHNRLDERYKDKPFHRRNLVFFYLAIGFGWASNLVSGVTESAKVYSFADDIFSSIDPTSFLSLLVMVIGVIAIELLNRTFGKSYFKNFALNNGHHSDQNTNLIGMIVCFAISCFLSTTGQFDALRIITTSPEKQEAQQYAITELMDAVSPIVGDANSRASEYFQQRKWHGRISTEDAVKYKEYLDHASQMEDSLMSAILTLPQRNAEAVKAVEEQFQEEQQLYESEIKQKGNGLLFVTIPSLLLLYLCLWYEEIYLKKKHDYLTRVYGTVAHTAPLPSSTPQGVATGTTDLHYIAQLLQQLPQLQQLLQHHPAGGQQAGSYAPQQQPQTQDPSDQHPSPKARVELDDLSVPIGYKSDAEKEAYKMLKRMASKAQQQPQQFGYDKFTVLHFDFRNGQPKRLTKDRVNWYVKDYAERLQRLRVNPDATTRSLENCEAKNLYWQLRQQELFTKMKA